MSKKKLSIVCPVFNEAQTIPLFLQRLRPVTASLAEELSIEIIFVDNCSTDDTPNIVQALSEPSLEIYHIRLARNFGYQASLTCGLAHATGDIIVNIDVDCEDPPEMIPRFVEGWKQGYDVVYGVRRGRPEGRGLLFSRRLFYRLTRLVADSDFILDMAEFLLLTSTVRDAILRSRTTFPFIRSEVGYVGFRRLGIPYDRQQRIAGKSNYNLLGLLRFALAGMLSSSTFPLRLISYIGLPLFALNVVVLALELAGVSRAAAEFLGRVNGAFLVMTISFLAIYLARTYKNSMDRPIYIVDRARSRLPAARIAPGGETE